MAQRVDNFNLGRTVNENSSKDCTEVIERLLNLSKQELDLFGFEEYLSKNGRNQLKNILQNLN
jgi:hypothetical protein